MQFATKSEKATVYVAVYNALGWERSEILSLPVSSSSNYSVTRVGSEKEINDIDSALHVNMNSANVPEAAPFNLFFDTGDIKPAAFALYKITKGDPTNVEEPKLSRIPSKMIENSVSRKLRQTEHRISNKDLKSMVVGNGVFEITLKSDSTPEIKHSGTNTSLKMNLDWGFYRSFQGEEEGSQTQSVNKDNSEKSQNSGAYIFRPSSPNEELELLTIDPAKTKIHRSNLLTEIHFGFEVPWIKQTWKMFEKKNYVDVDYTIGPIPIKDGVGKEVIARLRTNIVNDGEFFTDSNGREFMKRKRSNRSTWDFKEFQPIAGNYYPVNSAIYIEDSKASLAIITDRTQGGSSLRDGSIELMVHRRTVKDDARGVGEAINETIGMDPYPPYGDAKRLGEGLVISGTHRIVVGDENNGALISRMNMDSVFSPLHMFVSSNSQNRDISFPKGGEAALNKSLPPNIQLITVKLLSSGIDSVKILLRLGHAFGEGEADGLSEPVLVDISHLLTNYKVKSIAEKTLSGNQDRSVWEQNKMIWTNDSLQNKSVKSIAPDKIFCFVLNPMEIKTFEIEADRVNVK